VSAFIEKNGMVVVEAEHYNSQALTKIRKWYTIDANSPQRHGNTTGSHFRSASAAAYLEILPDTRTNHDEKLIHGENFSNEPGKLGVLHYYVIIDNPGKYFVWVRAYSTGTEDNGLHVGIDDQWVESGQRMQWCEDKNRWTWASKQRTEQEHCGVERLIYLQIEKPGLHKISFSMREDGFEFDKWILSKDYQAPENAGPQESPTKIVSL
jgi:hypothetical protein